MSIGFGNVGRSIWDQPLVPKAIIVGREISWIASIVPIAVFVDLVRDLVQ